LDAEEGGDAFAVLSEWLLGLGIKVRARARDDGEGAGGDGATSSPLGGSRTAAGGSVSPWRRQVKDANKYASALCEESHESVQAVARLSHVDLKGPPLQPTPRRLTVGGTCEGWG
jgi:hypothetical protein